MCASHACSSYSAFSGTESGMAVMHRPMWLNSLAQCFEGGVMVDVGLGIVCPFLHL